MKCQNCGEKIGADFNFCPYCRAPTENPEDGEDWGLLGKNDLADEELKFPMGFNTLFNSLLKNLNGQFKELENLKDNSQGNDKKTIKKGGISISISTSGNRPPEIKVTSFGNGQGFKNQEGQIKEKVEKVKLPESDSRKFAGLPKKEPETSIRRLSNKVVYEINLPEVKSVRDISIIQLENSIEIKALGKGKVFQKVIPINLPIRNYVLANGKLVLELEAKE